MEELLQELADAELGKQVMVTVGVTGRENGQSGILVRDPGCFDHIYFLLFLTSLYGFYYPIECSNAKTAIIWITEQVEMY